MRSGGEAYLPGPSEVGRDGPTSNQALHLLSTSVAHCPYLLSFALVLSFAFVKVERSGYGSLLCHTL